MRNGSSSAVSYLKSYKWVWRVAVIAALVQACYAGMFIYQSSFPVEGQRYFCLFDDAMISMRHAANWADGHGFVWNPGERVEGYTNFGWTAIMGLCHLLRLSPSQTALLIQLLGIPVLWGCLAGTILLAKSCRLLSITACCAVVLGVTQWNLNFFTLMGMETGLLTCVMTLALRESVVAIQRREGRVTPMIWFAAALLIRPDALILLLFSAAYMMLTASRRRSRTLLGLLIVAILVSAHLLWRHHFYGEWLPNTYYMKATGWALADRIPVGLHNSLWTAATLGLPLLVGLAALIHPRHSQFFLLGAFVLSFAYQVYVGGDTWPKFYRLVLPATLGLMVLAAEGVYRISRFFSRPGTGRNVRLILTLVLLVAINGTIHRNHWLLQLAPPGTIANRDSVRRVFAADQIANPEATAAVGWAGAFPYFSSRKCFDLMGRCDPYIARLPAHPEIKNAGHNKFDAKYTLSTYRPDMVVDGLRIMGPEIIETYRPIQVEVDGAVLLLSVRKTSLKIRGGKRITWETARPIIENSPRF